MTPREKSFWWKIGYLVAIAALLIPLFLLGHPATSDREGPGGKEVIGEKEGSRRSEGSGGTLARLRDDYGLSQKHLGQIDATSETIKLATLGLRPVAASILWGKAQVYKKKKDWTNLEATVNQITSLQPNFIEIWVFQGWNLSYNVSAEFDGYRDRYHYVIKGIDFLRNGIEYNRREPRLLWEVGWFSSQKIGRADESKQYRRLFREDDQFHNSLPFQLLGPYPRDNWLVGREWFHRATDLVDRGLPMSGKGPLIYRSSGPMCQMNYADTLEVEGHFGSVAQLAWEDAARDWDHYGSVDLPTYGLLGDDMPMFIQLNDLDRGRNYLAQIEQAEQELYQLEPGLRETIRKEREEKLSDEQRQALDTPPEERTATQRAIAEEAEKSLEVTREDLAKRISDPQKRARAAQLLKDLDTAQAMADLIRHKREPVNFDYWRLRAAVEQADEAVAAHEWIYKADQDVEASRLEPARENFDQGLAAWRRVIDKFPEVADSKSFGGDLIEVIQRYRELLDHRDEKQRRDLTYGKDRPLFTLGQQYQDDLDRGVISADLRREFDAHEVPLSDGASVAIEEQGSEWSITDQTAMYRIRKEADSLEVLQRFILADVVERYQE
jgi:hypothetical protein